MRLLPQLKLFEKFWPCTFYRWKQKELQKGLPIASNFWLNLGTITIECFQLASSANDYAECIHGIITYSDLTANYIVGNLLKEGEDDSESEDAIDNYLIKYCSTEDCIVWSKEILLKIESLKKYLSQQNNVPETFYTILRSIEDFVLKNA